MATDIMKLQLAILWEHLAFSFLIAESSLSLLLMIYNIYIYIIKNRFCKPIIRGFAISLVGS